MKAYCLALALFIIFNSATSGEIIIRGKITGYDGKPLKRADVHIGKINSRRITAATAAENGSFSFSTPLRGAVTIEFSGVDHLAKKTSLFLGYANDIKPIEINARLEANTCPQKIDSIKIIGKFNNFDFNNGKKMTLTPNGSYIYMISKKRPILSNIK